MVKVEPSVSALDAAPDYAPGSLLRFSLQALDHAQDAPMLDLCKATAPGAAQARQKLEQLQFKCP